ncbi:MAG: HAMP domain-containing protein [Chloroflexi bacterium]|nr:HAMP domain-containing protein [Chloroflexota bacterium]
MSLKARLALLQVAILAVGLALLGTLLVESLERSLRGDADEELTRRADEIQQIVRARLNASDSIDALAGLNVDPSASEEFSAPGIYVEIRAPDGRLIVASRGLPAGGLPWSADAVRAARLGQTQIQSLPVAGGERVRLLTVPVLDAGQLVAVLQVGESLSPIDAAIRGLNRILLVGGTIILLACTTATWMVVSRALEPLEQIAATAERIAATGDVNVRVGTRASNEIARLAASFNRMIDRLRHVLDTQRQLLADTSHELRNPLTVIRTDLGLLARDLEPDVRREVAGEAEAEAERMTRLVGDLLFLAREESGTAGPVGPVRLDLLARDAVERLRQIAPDHHVGLAEAEPAVVQADPDRLRQVLDNLLDNAARYTPAGGTVTASVVLDRGRARLDVTDTGIGIPAEHLPRVFDRFYRVDPARSRATGGTGLGLAIVRHIVESYGGTVTAQSEPGRGSRFTVYVPAAQPSASADSAPPAGSGASEREAPGLTRPAAPAPADRAASAAPPSGREVGSRPGGTPTTPDHPERRP